ncbi:FAD-dependent oxidoreductase, partial [Streptomyces vinaceusdrappus]
MAPSAMSRSNDWTKSLSDAQPVPYWLDDPCRPRRQPALTGPDTCHVPGVGARHSGSGTAPLPTQSDPTRQ